MLERIEVLLGPNSWQGKTDDNLLEMPTTGFLGFGSVALLLKFGDRLAMQFDILGPSLLLPE